MRPLSAIVILAVSLPAACFGQKREIIEMQRDIASLQEQMKTLQRTLDEKMGVLSTLIQQTLDNTNKLDRNIAVMQSGIGDRLREQEKTVGAPIVGLNSKIDQLIDDMRAVRENVQVVSSRMDKLQTQMSDVERAVKVMQAPPAPPSGTTQPAGGQASAPPPGVTATSLYDGGRRDFGSGNYDLALQQFTDFLKWFSNTDLAPNAQFYVGMIYYNKADMENAVPAFDQVLTAFPENNKTADAMLMKGQSLVKAGKKTAGADEFKAIIKKYPSSDQAAKARINLKNLGFNVPAAPAGKRRR